METLQDTYLMETKIKRLLCNILGFNVTVNIHLVDNARNTCNVNIEPFRISLTNISETIKKGQIIYNLLKKTNIPITAFITYSTYITNATFPSNEEDINSLLTLIQIQL